MALLENIRVFVRVVELGSLSAAGRHLRLSPAVVSHRLQQLEQPSRRAAAQPDHAPGPADRAGHGLLRTPARRC